jgi:hypothetical protein
MLKNLFLACILKVNDVNSRIQDPDPLVRGMDPRIRIHPKMSWIRYPATNTSMMRLARFTCQRKRLSEPIARQAVSKIKSQLRFNRFPELFHRAVRVLLHGASRTKILKLYEEKSFEPFRSKMRQLSLEINHSCSRACCVHIIFFYINKGITCMYSILCG